MVVSFDHMWATLGAGPNLRHPTQHGHLVDRVGLWIVSRPAAPGEQLPPEEEFAAGLGVSRAALREVIKALAAKGLVELRPRTGTRVRPTAEWNFLDRDVLRWQEEAHPELLGQELADLRRAVEPTAASLAALKAQDVDLSDMATAFAAMSTAAKEGNYTDLIEADVRFHLTILRACQNNLFIALGKAIETALRAMFVASSQTRSNLETIPSQHGILLEAVLARDPEAAATAAAHLTARFAEDLLVANPHEASSLTPPSRRDNGHALAESSKFTLGPRSDNAPRHPRLDPKKTGREGQLSRD